MRNYNDQTTWEQMLKERDLLERRLDEAVDLLKRVTRFVRLEDTMMKHDIDTWLEEFIQPDVMRSVVRHIDLLREQLRVADVAYNYWTQRCRELEEANERANKLIEDEANKRAALTAALTVAWTRNSNHETMTFEECNTAREALNKL